MMEVPITTSSGSTSFTNLPRLTAKSHLGDELEESTDATGTRAKSTQPPAPPPPWLRA